MSTISLKWLSLWKNICRRLLRGYFQIQDNINAKCCKTTESLLCCGLQHCPLKQGWIVYISWQLVINLWCVCSMSIQVIASGGFPHVLPENVYLPAMQKVWNITDEHWVVHPNCHYCLKLSLSYGRCINFSNKHQFFSVDTLLNTITWT